MSDAAHPAEVTAVKEPAISRFNKVDPAVLKAQQGQSPLPTSKASKAARAIEALARKRAAAVAAKESAESPAAPAEPEAPAQTEPMPAEPAPVEPAPAEPPAPEPELAKVAEAPKSEETPNLKAQFSAIAKADRRIREERRAIEAERQQARAEIEEAARIKQLMQTDKPALLRYLGVDFHEWAAQELGEKPTPTPKPQQPEQDPYSEQLIALEQRIIQAMQYQTAKQTTLANINDLVQNNADRYAYIKARNAQEAVFATIESYWGDTGTLMGVEQAADLVEQYFETDAESYRTVEKFKRGLAPQGAATKATVQPPGGQTATRPQTVTKTVNDVPDRVAAPRLSKAERRKRAAAIFASPKIAR